MRSSPGGPVIRRRPPEPAPADPGSAHRRNALLARLPAGEVERLVPHLSPVHLGLRDPIERRGTPLEAVYFPLDLVASVVDASDPADEAEVEVATIGREGVTGMHAFLGATTSPFDTYCQVPGRALRLPVDRLRGFLVDDGALHALFQLYAQVIIGQLARNVVCHQRHQAEQRTARVQLTTHDRAGVDTFTLTQEFLAQMLGVRRVTVSEIAGRFQQQGLVRYIRGQMTVTDRAGLEAASCPCYRLLDDQTRHLLDQGDQS